ncbi:MAG: TonB-dependent receptor [bacterium]|nr:TonB-dependent receptor [Candidatus Kapabacteria bacterium]
MRILVLAICSLPLLFANLLAQTAQRATIDGRVLDKATAQPVVGASVEVIGTRFGAITRADGRFTITVDAGTYSLRIVSIGYEPRVVSDISVSAVRPASVEAELVERAVEAGAVVVRPDYFGDRRAAETSSRELRNEEIRRLPGGFEDVVRAISSLPGVAQVSNARNDLLVRGGGPSENLYLIDGVEVPNINHFGTQGSGGGPLSYINLDFVDDIRFSTGGFGVAFGDRTSSSLEIDLRDARSDRFGGKATISASQFGINIEGPLSDDIAMLASARRSYLDFIFRAAGFSFVPEYWDFMTKLTWRAGQTDRVSFVGIGAIDRVRTFDRDADDRFENARLLDNSQDQLVLGANWRHLFATGYVSTSVGMTSVDYKFAQFDSLRSPVFTNTSSERELSTRIDGSFAIDDGTELLAGVQGRTVDFDADIFVRRAGGSLDLDLSEQFYKAAVYTQLARRFGDRLRATLGARVDYFSGVVESFVPSLRGGISFRLDDLSQATASIGRYHQSPSYIWLAGDTANRRLEQIKATVGILGIDRLLDDDLRVSI